MIEWEIKEENSIYLPLIFVIKSGIRYLEIDIWVIYIF